MFFLKLPCRKQGLKILRKIQANCIRSCSKKKVNFLLKASYWCLHLHLYHSKYDLGSWVILSVPMVKLKDCSFNFEGIVHKGGSRPSFLRHHPLTQFAPTPFLKVVSATFLLVCFSSLKERNFETLKNVFYFSSKALSILKKSKF